MVIATTEAARRLGLHPAGLFQALLRLDRTLGFEDVWPNLDEGWVQTLQCAEGGTPTAGLAHIAKASSTQRPRSAPAQALSEAALHVLDKLARRDKWGVAAVSKEALTNLTRLPGRTLEDAIAELRRSGLLDHDGTGLGTISLASSQRKRIESLTDWGSSRGRQVQTPR